MQKKRDLFSIAGNSNQILKDKNGIEYSRTLMIWKMCHFHKM